MAYKKKLGSPVKSTSTSVQDFGEESGVVSPAASFSKEEAVALRVLMAFIEGKQGAVGVDVVKDVWSITRKFAEEADW
jgi:hypothetical protein